MESRAIQADRTASARRPGSVSLVIFHGDVGTGKTATAGRIADALSRDLKCEGMLFSLSTRVRGTRVRGSGMVGQMS